MAFGRIVELQIINPQGLSTIIKNLRIKFNVTKSNKQSANKAEIEIYNVSDITIPKINSKDSNVVLRAGYEDEGGAKSIFFGQLKRAITKFEPPNRILAIEAYDGTKKLNETNFNVSYKAGTPVLTVINDITSVLGLVVANPQIIVSITTQYTHGFAFCGRAKDALTKALNYIDKKWSVQNNELIILGENDVARITTLKLGSNSGLLTSPEALEDSKNKISTQTSKKRYKIKSLLFPQLTPGFVVIIDGAFVKGNFKVENTVFSGDNYGDDNFIAECEVVAL